MSKHPIVHVEFSANDRETAGDFYSKLFDWKVQQMPEMNYASFDTGEGVGGGSPNQRTNIFPQHIYHWAVQKTQNSSI